MAPLLLRSDSSKQPPSQGTVSIVLGCWRLILLPTPERGREARREQGLTLLDGNLRRRARGRAPGDPERYLRYQDLRRRPMLQPSRCLLRVARLDERLSACACLPWPVRGVAW